MPAIKKTNPTELYSSLRSESRANREDRDCAVVAIAAVTGVTYKEAHAALKENGRQEGRGTNQFAIEKALHRLGFGTVLASPSSFIRQYPKAHQILGNVTTHHPERFNKVWADGNNYLLFTKGHVAGIVNGENHDWTKGTAKRVHTIWKICELH